MLDHYATRLPVAIRGSSMGLARKPLGDGPRGNHHPKSRFRPE